MIHSAWNKVFKVWRLHQELQRNQEVHECLTPDGTWCSNLQEMLNYCVWYRVSKGQKRRLKLQMKRSVRKNCPTSCSRTQEDHQLMFEPAVVCVLFEFCLFSESLKLLSIIFPVGNQLRFEAKQLEAQFLPRTDELSDQIMQPWIFFNVLLATLVDWGGIYINTNRLKGRRLNSSRSRFDI